MIVVWLLRGQLGLFTLGASTVVMLVAGALPDPTNSVPLAAGVSMAIWMVHGVLVLMAPRDLLLISLGAVAYFAVQHLVGQDTGVTYQQNALNLGIAFCVRPFVGLALRSARESDRLTSETQAAQVRARLLASDELGRAQARRILHDEVMSALRSVVDVRAHPAQVRRSCAQAADAVRRGARA